MAWGDRKLAISMDVLASILAYLGVVATILVTIGVGYDKVVYAPLHSPMPPHALAVAAKPAAPSASVHGASPAPIVGARANPAAATRSPQLAAAERAAPQTETAAVKHRPLHPRVAMTREQRGRAPARQEPGREWASEQAPRALGYADEPRALFSFAAPTGFGYDRY
jgi:hypothetical protein